ncbi:MAG: hypothetical protein JWP57_4201 [Spirosoma sp.]|nr:hypothetical protein [Spirosoma sp.]
MKKLAMVMCLCGWPALADTIQDEVIPMCAFDKNFCLGWVQGVSAQAGIACDKTILTRDIVADVQAYMVASPNEARAQQPAEIIRSATKGVCYAIGAF